MAIAEAVPFAGPVQMAGDDRTIYHQRLQGIASEADAGVYLPKAEGDIYYLTATGNKRPMFWNGSAFKYWLLDDWDEVITALWTYAPATTRAPFALGANAYDQKVLRLNADLVDGWHASQAADASTVAVRDSNGRMKAADPSAADDVATKAWTETLTQGFKGRGEARIVLTGNFASTLAGNVLTATANGSINSSGITDGVTDLALNQEVLLVNQTNQAHNGKFFVSQVGDGSNPAKLTRTTNMDDSSEVSNGISVLVNEGTLNAGSSWALATTGTITLNTTNLVWNAYNRSANYTAGNGMVKVGLAFHAIRSAAYDVGGLVWANASATLTMTAALSGLIYSAGTAGPAAVTGLTATALPRYKTSGAYLEDSCLTDNGTILRTSRAFAPTTATTGTLDLGASDARWRDLYARSLVSNAGTGPSGQAHIDMTAGASNTRRWVVGLIGAETGSGNAGSDWFIARYDDSGGFLNTIIRILRTNGWVGINNAAPAARLDVLDTSAQIIARYDATKSTSIGTDASGNVTLTPSGGSGVLAGAWTVQKTGLNGTGAVSLLGLVSDAKTANDCVNFDVSLADSGSTSRVYSRQITKIITPTAGAMDAEWQIWLQKAGTLTQMLTLNKSGMLGVGSSNPQSALDLGAATEGRSIVWGGSGGANHYASLGASFSSAAVSIVSMLKLGVAADNYLVSYTGTFAHSGIRVGGSSTGDIVFFSEVATNRSVGDTFDHGAATRWTIKGATGVLEARGAQSITTTSNGNLTISPHGTGAVVVDKTLLVGSATAAQTPSGFGAGQAQIEKAAGNAVLHAFSNVNTADGSYLALWKSRSSVAGGMTIVQTGDLLGGVSMGGADGSVLRYAAGIYAVVEGTPAANDLAAAVAFHTGIGGGNPVAERARLTSAGWWLVGSTTAHSKMAVVTNGLGTTQTNTSGLAIVNETAAAAGAQQISPGLRFRGYGWKTNTTAASQAVDARLHLVPVEGAAAPTGYLSLQAAINDGSYAEALRIGLAPLTASTVLVTDANRQLSSLAPNATGTLKFLTQISSGAPVWTDLYASAATWSAAQTFSDAKLTLRAGVAAAAGAPLKWTAGTNLTTAEAGAMEYDGTHLYLTNGVSATRCAVVLGRSFLVGDGSTTTFTLTHNMGTQNIVAMCVRVSDNVMIPVGPKITCATTNTVTAAFSAAPTTNQYRIILLDCGA